MQQNGIPIRFWRILLCALVAIIISLLLCTLSAALIQRGIIPISFGPYAAQIGLCIGAVIGCMIENNGRGKGTAVDIAITGAVSAILLLLMKLVIYPTEQINAIRPISSIIIGCIISWFISRPRKRKRRLSRNVPAARK